VQDPNEHPRGIGCEQGSVVGDLHVGLASSRRRRHGGDPDDSNDLTNDLLNDLLEEISVVTRKSRQFTVSQIPDTGPAGVAIDFTRSTIAGAVPV
jgi:hypothetical protein